MDCRLLEERRRKEEGTEGGGESIQVTGKKSSVVRGYPLPGVPDMRDKALEGYFYHTTGMGRSQK